MCLTLQWFEVVAIVQLIVLRSTLSSGHESFSIRKIGGKDGMEKSSAML